MVRCTDEGGGGRRGDSTATGLWLGVQMRGGGEGVTVLPVACG